MAATTSAYSGIFDREAAMPIDPRDAIWNETQTIIRRRETSGTRDLCGQLERADHRYWVLTQRLRVRAQIAVNRALGQQAKEES
jgi:hypothetical protein